MIDGNQAKAIVRRIVRLACWIVISLLLLLILLILLIRLPAVQSKITQKAISFLEEKIGTEVKLRSIYIQFPKKIVVEDFFAVDQSADTLLFVGQLAIDTDLWDLIRNRIALNSVKLENSVINIKRNKADTTFNFDYIVNSFTSKQSEIPDSTKSSPWQFSVSDVTLSEVKFALNDYHDNNFVKLKVGDLTIDVKKIELDTLNFDISSLRLANTEAIVTLSSGESAESPVNNSSGLPFNLSFKDAQFENVKLNYEMPESGHRLNVLLGELTVNANSIDLNSKSIDIEKVELNKSFVAYRQENRKEESVTPEERNSSGDSLSLNFEWKLNLENLALSNNGIQYDNFNASPTYNGFDANHFWIFNLQADANSIMLNGGDLKANIDALSLMEKKGLIIQNVGFNANLSTTKLALHDFNFDSGYSTINMEAEASFPSLADAINFQNTKIKLDIPDSYVAMHDVKFFMPELLDSLPVNFPNNARVYIDAQLEGGSENLNLNLLNLHLLDSTNLSMTARLQNLADWNNTVFNVEVNQLTTTRADVVGLLPDFFSDSSQVPNQIMLSGSLNGTLLAPEIDLSIETTDGGLEVIAKYNKSSNSYDGAMETKQLDLGKLLANDEMGKISMKANVKGSGLSLDSIDAKVEAMVDSFYYNEYNYKNFEAKGIIKNNFFSGSAKLVDDNLDFIIKGDWDNGGTAPHYKLDLNLKNADLQSLNFSDKPLKIRATLEADIEVSDSMAVNGNLAVRKVGVYNGKALYLVDSFLVASIDRDKETNLSIRSDIVSGNFEGSFNLLKLPKVLRQYVNQYFSVQDSTVTQFKERQQFEFDLTLKNTDLLTEVLFPELEPFTPGELKGEFDSELNKLDMSMDVTRIRYADTKIDSIAVQIDSDKEALNYKLRIRNVVKDSLSLYALELSGRMANDSLHTSFYVLDSLSEKKYEIGGVTTSLNNSFRFHLKNNQVILNYNQWATIKDNYLEFGNNSILANNFSLTSEEQKLSLVSSIEDSSFVFRFNQFELSNITSIISGTVPANGLLNGELKLTTGKRGEFNSNLTINEFEVMERKWGDVTIAVAHAGESYNAEIGVKGENLNLEARADYKPLQDGAEYDVDINFFPLNLVVVESLSLGQLKNVKGTAEGKINVSNGTKGPDITGEVVFKEASFLSTYLNNSFTLVNERILFRESGVVFNNFKVRDEKNNEATLMGNIKTDSFRKFDFDLQLRANRFQILNTRASDNSLYYGLLQINATANIFGSSDDPKVKMSVGLSDESNLTYIVPQSEKTAMAEKGIVQFVDRDAKTDPFLADIQLVDSTVSIFSGIDVTAEVDLRDKAVLNIVIDPVTGDKLSVKGNAKLILNVNPAGNINLSGRYEITQGSYNFSFKSLVKREFEIEKGSSIVWSGDPLNGTMDIRAIYNVDAPPIDLVYNQINTSDPSEVNAYSQRLPFLVYLFIKGQLLSPEIGFKIDMDEDDRGAMGGTVYAKLQDVNTRESDLNKQVFALLILKRFVSDNPMESQRGAGFSYVARESVSRMLSDQLNRLSENIKGVELSVDIKSYQNYSDSELEGETKVQLGVSKSLFDERLVVKLSGNVNVEGGSPEASASDYIGDIALEYKLTSDGRFRITGFRNSNFDIIDGELIETGAGIIYIKDYDTLRELFKSNAKEKGEK